MSTRSSGRPSWSTATTSAWTSSPHARSSTTRRPPCPRSSMRRYARISYRRDFTVNAMAASLKAEDFGRLVDPFGGRADLVSKTVRVLHNLSFIEDPTRIFRAIRYENRYGFRMDEHTARLARSCVEMGLVGDLSSARLRDELDRAARGGRGRALAAAPRRARRSQRDPSASGGRRRGRRLFDRARKLARELAIDVPAWRLGLACSPGACRPPRVSDWLDRLKVRRRDADLIAAAVAVGPRIADRLGEEPLPPSEIVAMAEQYAPDAPLFALALEELPPLRRYFEELRHVRSTWPAPSWQSSGSGESPRVGEILAELRRRKLDGELDGREAELAAARELIEARERRRADPLGRARAVRGRLLDPDGRRLGRRVRVAQPRPLERRRAGARRGEPAPAIRGGRRARRAGELATPGSRRRRRPRRRARRGG